MQLCLYKLEKLGDLFERLKELRRAIDSEYINSVEFDEDDIIAAKQETVKINNKFYEMMFNELNGKYFRLKCPYMGTSYIYLEGARKVNKCDLHCRPFEVKDIEDSGNSYYLRRSSIQGVDVFFMEKGLPPEIFGDTVNGEIDFFTEKVFNEITKNRITKERYEEISRHICHVSNAATDEANKLYKSNTRLKAINHDRTQYARLRRILELEKSMIQMEIKWGIYNDNLGEEYAIYKKVLEEDYQYRNMKNCRDELKRKFIHDGGLAI
jgi:hypothetical protein